MEKGCGAGRTGAFVRRAKRLACQEWDSNPRLQGRLRPERSALDRSAILTAGLGGRVAARLAETRRGASPGARGGPRGAPRQAGRRPSGVGERRGRPRRLAAPPVAPRTQPGPWRAVPSSPAPLLARRGPARAHRVLAASLAFSDPLLPAEWPRWRQEAARTRSVQCPGGSGSVSGSRAASVTEAVGLVGGRVGARAGHGGGVGRQPESPRGAGRQGGRRRPR